MSPTDLILYLLYVFLPIFAIYIGYLIVTKAFTDMGFNSIEAIVIVFLSFFIGYGLFNRIDLRARYEYIDIEGDGGKANIFGVGPKISILEDRIAAYLPVGFAFGGDVDGIEEFEFQPTLLFTIPGGRFVEINPSAKGILSEEDFYLAFNLGLGLSTNYNLYVLRPEYGVLINPGEEGYYSQFSVGATIYLFKK